MGINVSVLQTKLDLINRSLVRLRQLASLSETDFTSHPDNFAIAEHHLRRALEALFDIGRHIMAKEGLGHPPDYRSIIVTLGQHHIIDPKFAQEIKGMAGYRNRLVHGYDDVTPEEMHQILRTRLSDLEKFCREILHYMHSRGV